MAGSSSRTTLPRKNNSSIVGADIYLYDKRREDLDARIDAWINEPKHQDIRTRLGTDEEPEKRSIIHIWQGGIDEVSRALAKEREELMETHYFRDSYNQTSLLWRMEMSWWALSDNGYIDENGILNAETVFLLLERYNELSERLFSEEATTTWYEQRLKNGTLFSDDEGVEFWFKYFQEKGQRFVEFCQRTLDSNGYWQCSV